MILVKAKDRHIADLVRVSKLSFSDIAVGASFRY